MSDINGSTIIKNKLIIPAQFFGIGDIIFCMTLIRRLAGDKYKILWPVMPNMVDGLSLAYPDVLFVPFTTCGINLEHKEEYENEQHRYIPVRWSDGWEKSSYIFCMANKYTMNGMDYKTWKDEAHFVRDYEKEHSLCELVGLKIGERFNLVNRYFGTSSQHLVDIKIDNNLKCIEMKTIPGYSLFDWCYMIERAENIHVANSSILYLLELLTLDASEVNLYCRIPQENNFENTRYIHTKQYTLHL